jgi:4-aminobutyrate aminotransferase
MTDNADLIRRDAAVFFHQVGSSPCIASLCRASGMWIEDMAGNRFIDLHGNTCHHLGHAHPRLVAALKQQLDEFPFSPRRFTNAPATELGERLTAKFLGGRSRLLLMPGGSEAIETAIRLATIATGRAGIIALDDSYHGHGMGSLSLSKSDVDPRLPHRISAVFHIAPYWNEKSGGPDGMLQSLAACLEANRSRIACLVAEPMRSNCHVPPAWLWPRVAELCAAHGVKLIFDEIPSGLGKTGRFFAHEHFGVVPDMVILGKALGGGMLPLAAVIGDAELDIAPELSIGHYTHEKNPLLARAALTVLDILEDDSLIAKAAARGDLLHQLIDGTQIGPFRLVTRGLGLLRAVCLDGPRVGTGLLVETARACGLSTTAKDAQSIGLSPPLTITDDDARDIANRIRQTATRLSERWM